MRCFTRATSLWSVKERTAEQNLAIPVQRFDNPLSFFDLASWLVPGVIPGSRNLSGRPSYTVVFSGYQIVKPTLALLCGKEFAST